MAPLTKRLLLLTTLLSFSLLAGACGGSGGGSGSGGSTSGSGGESGGTGTVSLALTDAPFAHDIVKSATIVVSKIEIEASGLGDDDFLTVYDGAPRSIDLASLENGITFDLGGGPLPAGTFRQVRLAVDDATLELKNGNVYRASDGSLNLTSTDRSGLKIFIDPPVEVPADGTASVLIDFDLSRTFLPIPASDAENARKYLMRPVVRAVSMESTGVMRGVITDRTSAGPVEDATASLLPLGEPDPSAAIATTGTTATGEYAFLGVEPGTYDLFVEHGDLQGTVTGIVVEADGTAVADVAIE